MLNQTFAENCSCLFHKEPKNLAGSPKVIWLIRCFLPKTIIVGTFSHKSYFFFIFLDIFLQGPQVRPSTIPTSRGPAGFRPSAASMSDAVRVTLVQTPGGGPVPR